MTACHAIERAAVVAVLEDMERRIGAQETRFGGRNVEEWLRSLAERVAVLEATTALQDATRTTRKRAGGAA